MRKLPVLLVLAAVAAALLAAPAAQAWVRHETDRWVWYVPNSRWVNSQSDNGIDISSPTGELYVGHGFSGTPLPVTHAWVVRFVKQNRALDLHPLRRVRIGRGRSAGAGGGISRRVYKWSGYRKDRREPVVGVLTVDVIDDPATFSHGFATYSRVAPRSKWRRWSGKLRFIQKQIRLHPRTPEFEFALPSAP
jgi:hypothetical protein